MKSFSTYFVLFTILLISSCVYGQSSWSPKNKNFRAVKLFVNSDFVGSLSTSHTSISLLNEFSPSLAWGKNYGNFHELSVRDLGLMYVSKSREYSSTISYNYNVRVREFKPESKINFYMGAGVSAGFSYSKLGETTKFKINNSRTSAQINLEVIPRMTYKVNERTFVDLNIPYSVFSSSRSWGVTNNSEVPYANKVNSKVNNRAFPNQFTVSVGVAIKF